VAYYDDGILVGVNHKAEGINVLKKGGSARWVSTTAISDGIPNLGYGNLDAVIDDWEVGTLFNP